MLPWTNKHNTKEVDLDEDHFEQSEELQTFISDTPKHINDPIPNESKEVIIVISTSQPLMRTISFISSLVFLIALFIKFLFNPFHLTFIIISLPFSITVISLIMYLNSSIMLQSFLSKGRKTKANTIVSYICLNAAGTSMLLFICLLALRLDRIVSFSITTLLIPLLVSGSIYLSFAMMNKEIDLFNKILTMIDTAAIMICGLVIGNRIDNGYEYSFAYAFGSVYVGLLINFGVYYMSMSKQYRSQGDIMRLFGICIIGIGVIFIQVKLDRLFEGLGVYGVGAVNKRYWIDIALFALGYYSITFEFIFGTFTNDIRSIEQTSLPLPKTK